MWGESGARYYRVLRSPAAHAATVAVAATFSANWVGDDCFADEGQQGDSRERPSFKEGMLGSYENRIRSFSPPERVFEFFASVTESGKSYMTPGDFARAVTPYQFKPGMDVGSHNVKFNTLAGSLGPSDAELEAYVSLLKGIVADDKVTRQECKMMLQARKDLHIDDTSHRVALSRLDMNHAQFEKLLEDRGGVPRSKFFKMVDLDGDGLISYDEYMFFQTLLAIPRRRLALAFSIIDQDGSGSVDRTEFEAIMAVLRRSTQAGQAEYSRLGQGSVGCDALFGDSYTISLEHFLAFHDSLSEEVLRLQFAASDSDGSGELSAQEFALFLASKVNVDRSLQRQYIELARAPQVTLLKGSISLDDFLAFHDFLHYLDQLEVAAMVLGTPVGLNKDEFLRAAAAAVGGDEGRGSVKPGISPIIVDVLFALFDVDGNGRLSRDEFITIMRKQSSSVDPPRTLPLLSVLRRVRDCVLEQAPTLLKV